MKKNNEKFVYEVRQFKNIREMLEGSAEEFSERVAILFSDGEGGVRRVRYAELAADVAALATYLGSIGFAGGRIAVMGKNSYAWMLTYLAVTCGVGVIVPVDRELRAEDVGNILGLSGSEAILCDGGARETVAASGFAGRILLSDEIDDYLAAGYAAISAGDKSYASYKIDPDALGVLIYTSGTTGVAKGVMLSQYNICSNIIGVRSRVMIAPEDRSLSVLPLHHTYECMAGFLSFISAGASIAISEGLRSFVKELQTYKPTVLIAVPLLVESLHDKLLKKYASVKGGKLVLGAGRAISGIAAAVNIDAASSLFKKIHEFFGGKMNRMLIGAAPLSPATSRDFEAFGFKVYCGYGLTETAPVCIMHDDRNRGAEHIGRPISGVRVRLVETESEELSGLGSRGRAAKVGEIAVRGPNVMLGYYNDPDATAQVIRDGWFYTGDLASCDEQGNYRIVGRIKNVIVTQNGKKIFPEELEYRLDRSRFIKESMVCGVSDGRGEVVVTARVLPDFEAIDAHLALEGLTPDSPAYDGALRRLLLAEIEQVNKYFASYKAIRRLSIRRDEFVKTSSRKIRRSLPENHLEG